MISISPAHLIRTHNGLYMRYINGVWGKQNGLMTKFYSIQKKFP